MPSSLDGGTTATPKCVIASRTVAAKAMRTTSELYKTATRPAVIQVAFPISHSQFQSTQEL